MLAALASIKKASGKKSQQKRKRREVQADGTSEILPVQMMRNEDGEMTPNGEIGDGKTDLEKKEKVKSNTANSPVEEHGIMTITV